MSVIGWCYAGALLAVAWLLTSIAVARIRNPMRMTSRAQIEQDTRKDCY